MMRRLAFAAAMIFLASESRANSMLNGKIVANTSDTSAGYVAINSSNIVISTPAVIQGSLGADADAPGSYGQSVSTNTTNNTPAGSTTQYVNVVSSAVASGVYDCSGVAVMSGPNSAGWTDASLAVSVNSGNTTTDHVSGLNVVNQTATTAFGNNDRFTLVVPRYRVVSSTSFTIYLKTECTYSLSAPSTRFASLTCTRAR